MTRRGISLALKKMGNKPGPAILGAKFNDQLRASLKAAGESPRLTQAILNQLVTYVKLGLNRRGEKEIQIELHERIFRGLKLRVTSRDGKVGVHFHAADAKTRRLFEESRPTLHAALSAKGILVDEIIVS